MLPKNHIFYGAIFALLIFLIFQIKITYALIIFLAAFLIDFDHYLIYTIKKRDISLKNSFVYFKNMKFVIKENLKKGKVKSPLMIFHTFEFLSLVFILALFNEFFLFLLLGLLFHSILDIIDMQLDFKTLSPRSFSFFLYFIKKKDIKYL